MDLTPDDFEELVGAYALDACEPHEADAMERYLAANRGAAAEVERLREVAVGIATAGASRPPVTLRERLMHAAGDRVTPAAPAVALQRETDRFDSFLRTLGADDLEVVTVNGLTLRELVQHVEAVDRAFVESVDDGEGAFIGSAEAEVITVRDLSERIDEPFAETVARFRSTRRHLADVSGRVPTDQRVAGYTSADALVIRAFETWTHLDDGERALGRAATVPDAPTMRAMAELAMNALPLALAVRGTTRPGATARFVLEGAGGGEWSVPCAPDGQPSANADVVLRASVVDWCRRFADRIPTEEFAMSIDGDADLARELVAAANAFAGL